MDIGVDDLPHPASSSPSMSTSSSPTAGSLIDEYERLVTSLYLSSSHVHSLMHRLISAWNWTTMFLLVMRPETFAVVTLVLCILCLSHTFDLWSPAFAQTVPRASWIKFFAAIRGSAAASGRDADPSDKLSSFFTSGLQDSYHLKKGNVGVYAIRGRRAKMEDMFDYVDERQRLGIELFGVFDGHGSDVSLVLLSHYRRRRRVLAVYVVACV